VWNFTFVINILGICSKKLADSFILYYTLPFSPPIKGGERKREVPIKGEKFAHCEKLRKVS